MSLLQAAQRIEELEKQNKALKRKVGSAMQLLDWVSERISKLEYKAYLLEDGHEKGKLTESIEWEELTSGMRDGTLASYSEEFLYRDMRDEEIFGKKFCKEVWRKHYSKDSNESPPKDAGDV